MGQTGIYTKNRKNKRKTNAPKKNETFLHLNRL